ncbi:hypothetical protein REPUB_Repub01dG0087500 [Reevesia pubescens]
MSSTLALANFVARPVRVSLSVLNEGTEPQIYMLKPSKVSAELFHAPGKLAKWISGHPSGMPIMPLPSPHICTHQMMFHGNHAICIRMRGLWHAQNMHQNAWLTESMRQQCISSPEKYGRFGGGYVINAGPVASTGGNYPNLIASSEYESFNRTQSQLAPAEAMRFEAMRYEHGNWGGDGRYRQSYGDGFNMQQGNGCQGMEWVLKGL